jgi:hypothetical protein
MSDLEEREFVACLSNSLSISAEILLIAVK